MESRLVLGAVLLVAAVDGSYPGDGAQAPHRVDKLYWMAMTRAEWDTYTEAFGELVSRVGGASAAPRPGPTGR